MEILVIRIPYHPDYAPHHVVLHSLPSFFFTFPFHLYSLDILDPHTVFFSRSFGSLLFSSTNSFVCDVRKLLYQLCFTYV